MRRRGVTQGLLELGFVKKYDNSHRYCCKNYDMHKAGKVNSHGGCGGGIFGKKLMIIETTTIGGVTNHHHLSQRQPINIPIRRRTGHMRGNSSPKSKVFDREDAREGGLSLY